MAPSPDMQTLAARLATFDGPKQVAKRRASSNSKKKQTSTVSWPHQSPTPEELAEAGFFYKPTADSHDSVTCYLCGKSLDGWEDGDNPAKEHLSHVPDCGWAINVCIGQRREEEDRAEEDPLTLDMIEARTSTFADQWPHETKKGWKPKIKKMVEAGWCYSPLPEYDDCVMCFYCGTSLDGWEPKDDPAKEHRKRAEDCHFFTLVEESKKLKNGKGKKTARASKASRASTMTVDSEQVSFAATDVDDPAVEGESMMSTTSTASKATRGRSRTAKAKATTRSTRTRKDESFLHPNADEEFEADVATEETKAPPKRGRTKRVVSQQVEESATENIEPETQPLSKKAPARKRATKLAAADSSVIEADASVVSTQTETRATRGRKRHSNGEEKLDSSIVIVEDTKAVVKPAPKSKPKRAPAKKQDAAKEDIDEDVIVEQPAQLEVEEEKPQPAKTGKKKATGRQKGSAQTKRKPSEQEREILVHDDNAGRGNEQSASQPQRQAVASPPRPAPPANIFSPSPQSSDAENVPPSSRPSTVQRRTVLSPVEDLNHRIQTPRTSPSKRTKTIGGLISSAPWTQIDLDSILLPSPTAATVWAPQHMKLDEVLDSMTSPEKRMTVEEWIIHNASRAETALRDECERMIVQFENEGNRAVRAVEGIECD